MIGLAPSVFKGATSAPDPIAIFGANLTAWYDAAVGVTQSGGSPDRVNRWDEQSGNGGFANQAAPTTSNTPKYVAVDVDGTPSVWFDPAENHFLRRLNFAAGFPVSPLTTCYLFGGLPNLNGLPDMFMWSTGAGAGFARGWTSNQIPSVHRGGTTYTPPIAGVDGWAALRWGGNNGATLRRVAVNADAENTAAGSWIAAGNDWTHLSRSDATQYFRGYIKQIVVTNTFVANVDAEHAAMLAYFKSRYPTLVTY